MQLTVNQHAIIITLDSPSPFFPIVVVVPLDFAVLSCLRMMDGVSYKCLPFLHTHCIILTAAGACLPSHRLPSLLFAARIFYVVLELIKLCAAPQH